MRTNSRGGNVIAERKIRVLKKQSKMIEGGIGTICTRHCRQKIEEKGILVIENGRGKDKSKRENERVKVKGRRPGGNVKCYTK